MLAQIDFFVFSFSVFGWLVVFSHNILYYHSPIRIKKILVVTQLEFSEQRSTHEGFSNFTVTQKKKIIEGGLKE